MSRDQEFRSSLEPGNQNQSLAAAILACLLTCYFCTAVGLLLLYYLGTQYALRASFSSTNDWQALSLAEEAVGVQKRELAVALVDGRVELKVQLVWSRAATHRGFR